MNNNYIGLKSVTPLRKPVKCPNCSSNSNRETYPFCSTRCKDVDLNRWFNQSYAIPVQENDHGMEENS
ncbi:MAG: DNA gyrase inhibitor YacG [Nitratireductor sp.]